MPDILDEIKEDITREKYAQIWQKYGNHVIGAAIAALIITGAAVAGKNYLASRYSDYNDALYEANTAPEDQALAKYDEIIANSNGTYQAIAALRKAGIFLHEGKNEDAMALYKRVFSEFSSPKELADLAKLLYITVSSNMAVDSNTPLNAEAQKYLEESSASGAFKYSAMEISAFQEIIAKNYPKAKEIFANIAADNKAPVRIKNRANEMLESLKDEGVAG